MEVATARVDLLHLVKVAAADVGADVAVETLGSSVKGQRLACVSHLKAAFFCFVFHCFKFENCNKWVQLQRVFRSAV